MASVPMRSQRQTIARHVADAFRDVNVFCRDATTKRVQRPPVAGAPHLAPRRRSRAPPAGCALAQNLKLLPDMAWDLRFMVRTSTRGAGVSIVTLAAFLPLAMGCTSNEYVIPHEELARLAATPPPSRG